MIFRTTSINETREKAITERWWTEMCHFEGTGVKNQNLAPTIIMNHAPHILKVETTLILSKRTLKSLLNCQTVYFIQHEFIINLFENDEKRL